ncbi:MAG: hypothetical protein ACLQO7_11820 [Candidatus Bathyarchaeia archaeon]
MVSLLVAQVNIVFQTALFVLLFVSILFIRKRKIKAHAQITLAVVVLNIVSFVAVMSSAFSKVSSGLSSTTYSLAMIHGSVGGLALLLSVWVVGVWLLSPLMVVPVKFRCSGALNRRLMFALAFLWFASLILGFLLYAALRA